MKDELKLKMEITGASKYKREHEGPKEEVLELAIADLQKLREKLCPTYEED